MNNGEPIPPQVLDQALLRIHEQQRATVIAEVSQAQILELERRYRYKGDLWVYFEGPL